MHAVNETTKYEKRDAEESGRFYSVLLCHWSGQLMVVTEQISWLGQELYTLEV